VDRNEPGESYRCVGAFSKVLTSRTLDLSSEPRTETSVVGWADAGGPPYDQDDRIPESAHAPPTKSYGLLLLDGVSILCYNTKCAESRHGTIARFRASVLAPMRERTLLRQYGGVRS
jgi:hypothetical protein